MTTATKKLLRKHTGTFVTPYGTGQYSLHVVGNPRGKQIYMVRHDNMLVRQATDEEVTAWHKALDAQGAFETLLQKHQVTSRYVTERG